MCLRVLNVRRRRRRRRRQPREIPTKTLHLETRVERRFRQKTLDLFAPFKGPNGPVLPPLPPTSTTVQGGLSYYTRGILRSRYTRNHSIPLSLSAPSFRARQDPHSSPTIDHRGLPFRLDRSCQSERTAIVSHHRTVRYTVCRDFTRTFGLVCIFFAQTVQEAPRELFASSLATLHDLDQPVKPSLAFLRRRE